MNKLFKIVVVSVLGGALFAALSGIWVTRLPKHMIRADVECIAPNVINVKAGYYVAPPYLRDIVEWCGFHQWDDVTISGSTNSHNIPPSDCIATNFKPVDAEDCAKTPYGKRLGLGTKP